MRLRECSTKSGATSGGDLTTRCRTLPKKPTSRKPLRGGVLPRAAVRGPFTTQNSQGGNMNTSVERILLGSTQLDRRVALATVKIGDVSISGVTVWRGGNGRLSVYWPRFWNGAGQADVIHIEAELRGDVEADVI